MRIDKRRISDIRNLIHKPVRRVLFVSVFLILSFCFLVPAYAVDGVLDYEDVFDDSNSVAVVRISREIRYYVDESSSFESQILDDYYQSTITESQIAIFSQTEWNNIIDTAQTGNGSDSYSFIEVCTSVDLVYRHYEDDTATFPVANVKSFAIREFRASCNLSPTSIPAEWTFNGYQYSLPGSPTVYSVEGDGSSGDYIISLSVPGTTSGLFYHNSIQLKSFDGVFKYYSDSFSLMRVPILEFSFSNVYQYTIDPAETTQIPDITSTPETSAPVFVPGEDTVIASDTMQGNPDDLDNVLDDRYQDFVDNYTDILNGFSWVKYASCFGFIGRFFGLFFQFEPIADILNAWAIFAVFNILLGGFITGVSAIVRHHSSHETKSKENSERKPKGGDK